MLSPAQRATALLERYPELLILPNCDWDRLSVTTVFGLLFGASSRHFARIELATLAGILTTAGVSTAYMIDGEHCMRAVLNLIKHRFGIGTPHAITLDMWEEWGRDIDLMRTLPNQVAKYAAAVNYHTPGTTSNG
jgi:hypothetical protein